MNARHDSQAALRKAIHGRTAVLVAGTGVSISATYDASKQSSHPQASWAGLLEHGLTWLEQRKLVKAAEAQAHLSLLSRSPQPHHFISAAQDVVAGMGGPGSKHFRGWLEQTVGTIRAKDCSVLDALHALRQYGNLLATTNYDGLLLGDPATLTPVTWRDSDEFVGAIRNRDTNSLLFLHGFWLHPESVILDWDSYHQIAQSDEYQADLTAFWKLHTWVYVGCGPGGLTDPDLGVLLKRYGNRARRAGHFDFCLVRDSERDAFDALFREENLNILAVPYGSSHSDLAPYLHSLLPSSTVAASKPKSRQPKAPPSSPIPRAPAPYAKPPYIGSHNFVGRKTQLEELTDWARPADPNNLLLFEAIGGNGKSMLTWEWMTNPAHAPAVRTGADAWAGSFWFSFYERGAVMAHFCQHALAYMTGQPLKKLLKKKTIELIEPLLDQLQSKPWLIVLDGLERVLVAYHRIDAAQLPDEEASHATDQIIDRNPRDAIHDEDNDLLRALAGARPSKILVSSRLTPRVLLNPSDQPISGVKRIILPGLRPPDAEQLLRSCGATGDGSAMQRYLATNCDNHPLVIGVLGGLIVNYLPARGDFDAWASSEDGGAKLDLGSLDLINRRNHILEAAVEALLPERRQVLFMLSLLRDSIDYEELKALNPLIPPPPEYVKDPDDDRFWYSLGTHRSIAKRLRQDYLNAHAAWQKTVATPEVHQTLREAVHDLESRGLLQFDKQNQRYDLHPVIRGAASRFQPVEQRKEHGQRIVDYFSSVSHRPYKQADTLEDLRPGLNMVSILLRLGRISEAADLFTGDLSAALLFNVEAYAETLALCRAFLPGGWAKASPGVSTFEASDITSSAAVALSYLNETQAAIPLFVANLSRRTVSGGWQGVRTNLNSISACCLSMGQIAKAFRLNKLALDLATVIEDREAIFVARAYLFRDLTLTGRWTEAEAVWKLLDPMGRKWSRNVYRPGAVEYYYALLMFFREELSETHLAEAERLAAEGKSRLTARDICKLRGSWHLTNNDWERAAASFSQAVSMSRSANLIDEACETRLALAKLHLGQLVEPKHEAQRLTLLRQPAHYDLARLWLSIGSTEPARQHAVAAYKDAWADGEPYVKHYDLIKAIELMAHLAAPVPALPKYDPTREQPFSWEVGIRFAVDELKAAADKAKRRS